MVKPDYPHGEGQLRVHAWNLDDGVGGICGDARNAGEERNHECRYRHMQVSPAGGSRSYVEVRGIFGGNQSSNRNN